MVEETSILARIKINSKSTTLRRTEDFLASFGNREEFYLSNKDLAVFVPMIRQLFYFLGLLSL